MNVLSHFSRVRSAALSLAGKLTIWFAVYSFLLLAGMSVFVYMALIDNMSAEDQDHLRLKARLVGALLAEALPPAEAVQKIRAEANPVSPLSDFVRVRFVDGPVIAETDGMRDELPESLFPPAPSQPQTLQGRSGNTYLAVSRRVEVGSGRQSYLIQVASATEAEIGLLHPYRGRIELVFAVAFLLCGLAGYKIAQHSLRPVKDLVDVTRQISGTTLGRRVKTETLPAELRAVGETFNEMLDRLQNTFERVTHFSDDLAHELRTPLNIVRGQIEVTLSQPRQMEEYREVLESSLEEIVALSELIHRLLFLARAESPAFALFKDSRELCDELRATKEFYEPLAAEAGNTIEVEAPSGGLHASIDRVLFQQAVGNLVANAIRYTPAGGRVTLVAKRSAGAVRIEVRDTGRGIPAEHLPRMFDRFHRVEEARETAGHAGLGLPIAKAIVSLHGGTIAVDSEPGIGTIVSIVLPGSFPAP